jgi:TctA family transporter
MHFKPVMLIAGPAIIGMVIYWIVGMKRGKEPEPLDVAFFGGTVGGVCSALMLVVMAVMSVCMDKNYFGDTQYTASAVFGISFAIASVKKGRAMWRSTKTPNVDAVLK